MNHGGDLFQDPAFPWSIIGIALVVWFWWAVKDDPGEWNIVPRIGIACIAFYWMNRIAEAIGTGALATWTPRILAVALVFALGLVKWPRPR